MSASNTARPTATLRDRFESVEATALVGIAFAVLALIAAALLAAHPEPSQSQAELVSWYEVPANRWLVIAGLTVATIASILFLWFIAVVRRRVGDREDQFFSTVFLGSGILLSAILLVGATVVASIAVGVEIAGGAVPDAGSFTVVNGMAYGLLLLVLPRVQAVFIITTSTVGLRTDALPKWLAIAGYVVGIGMFVIPLLIEPILAVFPLWVGLMSSVLLIRTRRTRATAAEEAND